MGRNGCIYDIEPLGRCGRHILYVYRRVEYRRHDMCLMSKRRSSGCFSGIDTKFYDVPIMSVVFPELTGTAFS